MSHILTCSSSPVTEHHLRSAKEYHGHVSRKIPPLANKLPLVLKAKAFIAPECPFMTPENMYFWYAISSEKFRTVITYIFVPVKQISKQRVSCHVYDLKS